MKKVFFLLLFAASVSTVSYAQPSHRPIGTISADLGVGAGVSCIPATLDVKYTLFRPSPSVTLNAGASTALGLGLSRENGVNQFFVGPLFGINVDFMDQFEFFTKFVIGYKSMSYGSILSHRFGYGTYAGISYFPTEKIGIGGYLGYGEVSFVGVQLTFILVQSK